MTMGSLRKTLVVYFGLIGIIPLFFVGLILFYNAYTSMDSEISSRFQHDSEIYGNSMRLLFHLRSEQISALSSHPLFVEILQNNESVYSSKPFLKLLSDFEISTSGDLDEFYTDIIGFYKHTVISPEGLVLFSTDESLIGTNIIVDDFQSVSYVVDTFSNTREMIITVPVMDSLSDSQLGYLQSTMGVVTTNHILLDSRTFQTDENYLVDMDKLMISESRFWDSISSEIVVDTKPVQMCVEHGENYLGFYDDYRGTPIFGSSYCAQDLGFVLLREIDSAELFSPLNELIFVLLVSLFGFGSLSILFGMIISKKITLPLLKLKKSVEKITDGDLDTHISIEGQNEIFNLAKSFDEMLHSLKVSNFEIKTQQDIILENNRELKKVDLQKNEFAAMASHELKTPLVPIMGYLEMLLEEGLVGPINEKQKSILEKSLHNVKLLQKLILHLLTVHRLEVNQVNWRLSEFDVSNLLQDVFSDFEHLTQQKKIRFTNLVTDSILIHSDFEQIKEIFSNLLQNSIDFTPEGGSIEIDAKLQGDKIVFSVKDSGIGISKDKQTGLFKKFYQVDTSVTRKHGGTGLGLSICKGLTEGLGGKIWVESDEGQGSIFSFSVLKQFKDPKK